jgi:tetratricopeptide (TPR) repeat protein
MFDDAVKEFTKVTRLKPEYVEAYQRLWLAYKKLGMNDKAEEELQKYKKLIEERMQSMGGGSPQVAKPAAPPPKEEPPGKPKPEESKQQEAKADSSRSGEARPVDTIVLEKKPAEAKPPATETKTERPVVIKPGVPTEDEETKPPVVALRREDLKQAVKSPFTPQTKPIEIKTRPESVSAQPQYIKVDKKDPAYKSLFRPFKKAGAGLFQNPFKKKDGKGPKTYAGKLIKSLLSYVIVVQIWLCIVASLCIFFVRTKRE